VYLFEKKKLGSFFYFFDQQTTGGTYIPNRVWLEAEKEKKCIYSILFLVL